MRLNLLTSVFLLFWNLQASLSFQIAAKHSVVCGGGNLLSYRQSISDVNEDIENQLEGLDSKSRVDEEGPRQDFELWLDLRDTKMSPQVALSHLTNDLWDEFHAPSGKSFLVDRVLIDASKLSEGEIQSVCDEVNDEYEDEIKILFQKDGDIYTLDNGSNELGDRGDDTSFAERGKEFLMFDKETRVICAYSEPLPALEVTSAGKWLILNSKDMEGEVQRKESIQSLVELCSGGLLPTFDMHTLENKNNNDDGGNLVQGGIAIDCTTNAHVLEACSLIKSILGNSKDYITTDSGILFESNSGLEHCSSIGRGGIDYAVLIPLDALLWKTASFLATSNTQGFEDFE